MRLKVVETDYSLKAFLQKSDGLLNSEMQK